MANTNPTVALLDSQDTGLDMLAEMASSAGMVALPAHDLNELDVLFGRGQIDLLVINAASLQVPLASIFQHLAASLHRVSVLVLVEANDVAMAVEAMALGAKNVLPLPIEPGRFKRYLGQLLARQPDGFICRDVRSQQLLALSERVAQTDVTVLIGGESGAGKEVLAKHIHQASPQIKRRICSSELCLDPRNHARRHAFWSREGVFYWRPSTLFRFI